jgi:hypothetical protein
LHQELLTAHVFLLRKQGYIEGAGVQTASHIVTYFLEARTVEPEKQPLLANGSETTFVARQRRPLLSDRFLISRNRRPLLRLAEADVSEEYAASIFRFALCRVRNWLDCTDRLKERWSLRYTGRGSGSTKHRKLFDQLPHKDSHPWN